jgi:hypothetical protein
MSISDILIKLHNQICEWNSRKFQGSFVTTTSFCSHRETGHLLQIGIIMVKEDPEVTALKQELNELIAKCKEEQEKQKDVKLDETCADMADPPKCRLASKKVLKGHINKVNSIHFAGDSR